MLTIFKLVANNFKRLKAISINLEGKSVVIRGPNGAGKSSLLDAIMAVFCGKGSIPEMPLRTGTDKGDVTVELNSGLIIKRTFTAKDNYLEITSKDGLKYPTPQKMLDELLGDSHIAFDPSSFAAMKPKEQREELLRILKLSINLAEHDQKRKEIFDSRTIANRERDRLKAVVESAQLTPGTPTEEVSLTELIAESTRAQEQTLKINGAKESLRMIRAHIAELECKAEEQEAVANQPLPDMESIKTRINEVEETNNRIRANRAAQGAVDELGKATKAAAALDEQVKAMDKVREDALKAAHFPIAGLALTDDGITYNAIPFEQCASSERLKVSVAIAMAANPELHVITCRDASLLDKDGLKILEKMTAEKEFQLLLETVEEGQTGILIEDGQVAGQ